VFRSVAFLTFFLGTVIPKRAVSSPLCRANIVMWLDTAGIACSNTKEKFLGVNKRDSLGNELLTGLICFTYTLS
jgi:hypothetical protein